MVRADRIIIAPITDDDIDDVSRFLNEEMNARVDAAAWAAAMRSPWQHDPPNHGFMLRSDTGVVGAYLAFYSARMVRGRMEHFCNMAAWCVSEAFRFKGLRLMNELLAQEGYHFVDLSPSGNVVALNERLGFEHLDTTTAAVANLPWPTVPGRGRIVTDPDEIEYLLDDEAGEIHRDHAQAPAVRQLALVRNGRTCLVLYRRVRRKDLPLFAVILYVSDKGLFAEMSHYVTRHLLVRHAIPVTLVEPRVTESVPWPSRWLKSPRPKMFRSDRLDADEIDDLYSELVAIAW